MKKILILKISLFSVLFSMLVGCSVKEVYPTLTKNDIVGKEALYVRYESGNNFSVITNRDEYKSFILNDYKPMNFNYKKSYGKASLYNSNFKNSREYYQSVDKYSDIYSRTLFKKDNGIANIILIPVGVVYYPLYLLMGAPNKQVIFFDYQRFDRDVKKWVKENRIDRDLIIKNYDNLVMRTKELDKKISSNIKLTWIHITKE